MQTVLGIRGSDFVMLAADCSMQRSIVMMGNGNNFLLIFNKNLLLTFK